MLTLIACMVLALTSACAAPSRGRAAAQAPVRLDVVYLQAEQGDPQAVLPLLDAAARGDTRAADLLTRLARQTFTDAVDAAIADPSPTRRAIAARAVGARGDARAVPALAGLLRDRMAEVRAAAATALGAYRTPEAVAALATHTDTNANVRLAVLRALACQGDMGVAPAFVAATRDRDARGVRAAVAGLARLDTDVVPALLQALAHADAEVRGAAYAVLVARAASLPLEPVLPLLRDTHPATRALAARLLGETHNTRAFAHMEALLRDTDADVRRTAAGALGALGDPRAADVLRAKLATRDDACRIGAARGLAAMGARQATPALLMALDDPNPEVRNAAAAALGVLKAPEAVVPLCARLTGTAALDDRLAAIRALGAIHDARATDPLLAALKHRDPAVCAAAASALGVLGDPRAVAPLAAMLDDTRRSAAHADAVVALGALHHVRAIPVLADLVASARSTPLRIAAIHALRAIGGPRAVPPLIAAVSQRDGDIQLAAIEALGALRDAGAVPVLASLLLGQTPSGVLTRPIAADDAPGDEPKGTPFAPLIAARNLRAASARALGQTGSLTATEALLAGLGSSDPAVAATCARALGQVHATQTADALRAALRGSGYVVVRGEAAAALGLLRDTGAAVDLTAAVGGAPEVARRALWALGELRDLPPSAIDALVTALAASDPAVAAEASAALWRQQDRRGVQGLVAALGSQSRPAREAARRELGHKRNQPGLEALVGLLTGSEAVTRRLAAEALGVLRDPRAVPPLAEALVSDGDAGVRAQAAQSLGALRDERALTALTTALRDTDPAVREAARQAIHTIGTPRRPWFYLAGFAAVLLLAGGAVLYLRSRPRLHRRRAAR